MPDVFPLIAEEYLVGHDYVVDGYIEKATKKYAPLIGLFLIHFSSLEHGLDMAIADFLSDRSHDIGFLVIGGIDLHRKIELFRKLYHLHTKLMYPSRLKALSSLLKRLNEMRVFRNAIVHANWMTLDKNGYVRTKISEKEAEIKFIKMRITPQMIRVRAGQLSRIEESLYNFTEKALGLP